MAAVTWALVFAGESTCSFKLPLLCGLLSFICPELAGLSAVPPLVQAHRRCQEREGFELAARDIAITALTASPSLA
jgi:hypothetical protein